jgi:hypothetical protein
MKTHTKTPRPQILLGLLAASLALVGASVYSTHSGNYSAAVIRTSNDPKVFFDSVKTEPGCTSWLVHQHTGPTMTFWNANGSIALTQTGTSLSKDLKLSVPAGTYIKYLTYGGSDSHAMNVKLTDANNAQVGGWYIFSSVKNKSPYRYDASVDTNTAVNVYFKAGHILQSFNFLAVTYCPMQTQSSSSISSTGSVTTGSLFVTKSIAPYRPRQLLGGALEDSILQLTLRAEGEDIDITNLVFVSKIAFFLPGSDFDSLELFKAGSPTPFASATIGGCLGKNDLPKNSFCANLDQRQLIVSRGSNVDILVRPRVKNDEQGSVSGNKVFLSLFSPQIPWAGTEGVRARGVQTNMNLNRNDGDSQMEGEVFLGTSVAGPNQTIDSNIYQIVHSKVVSITNADPNSNGTSIAAGIQPIAQFNFSVAPHRNTKNGMNDWVLSGIIFDVQATNVLLGDGDQRVAASSDFRLYNKANPSIKAICTVAKAFTSTAGQSGALLVQCKDIISEGVNTAIDAGSDATFVLEALVSNPKILNINSSLQVSLTHNFNIPFGSTLDPYGSHFAWLDRDGGSTVQFYWIDYPESVIKGTLYQS